MSFNLEIKIKVLSHNKLISSLKRIGAEYAGVLNQKDIYFTTDKKLLKLRIQQDKMELIKYTRNENGKNRFSNYEILSVKGRSDFFREIFNTECIVTKKRKLWLFNNTRIHLDTVKDLGKFIELETLVINGKADAKKRFDKMIDLLELNADEQIRTSYRNLLLEIVNLKK